VRFRDFVWLLNSKINNIKILLQYYKNNPTING
jgi:hypothetical protein